MKRKSMQSPASLWIRIVLSMTGVLSLLTLVFFSSVLPASAAAHAPARPDSGGELNFVQAATSANTSGDSTFIDNALLNGNPSALLFVTASWNPNENYTGFDSAHTGVWYNSNLKRWAIFNENRSAMPVGAQFNVLAWTTSVASDGFFTVIAPGSARSYLFINNALANNNPGAHVFITPNWNPSVRRHNVYDTSASGVWYDPRTKKWEIYHENGTNIPRGAAFNVYIDASTTFPVTATTNTNGMACIANSFLNNNPAATPIITHNFTSNGITDVLGVWYDPTLSQWCIFDNTGTHLPADAQFFVEPLS